MMARHHVAFAGAATAVAAAWCYQRGMIDLPQVGAAVAIGGGAGLAPDVDEPCSSAPRTFGWLGMGAAHLVRLVVRKHRGATHTVEVMAGVCALLWWLGLSHPLVLPIAAGLAVAVGADTLKGVSSMQALAVGAGVGWWVALTVGPGEWWPVGAIAVGWVAHLLGDTLTPHGVPWSVLALPGDHRLSVAWFKTGSPVEAWVTAALVVGLSVLAWRLSGITTETLRLGVAAR
jgi:membrane-bound metal-dependent hydrolase YbcI (DUF457 family)